MAYDEGLAERIWSVLEHPMDIDSKKMFGGLAFMINGYMFCGIIGDELMARVGPGNYASALAEPHVRPMDFTGKPMKGYVYVETPGFEDDADLQKWVERCLNFVQTLPPKPVKAKSKKR